MTFSLSLILIALNPSGAPRGFAHVEFPNIEAATKVLEADSKAPFYLADRDLHFDYAPEKTVVINEPHHKLYIYDFDGDENALAAAFSEYSQGIVGTHMSTFPTASIFYDFFADALSLL